VTLQEADRRALARVFDVVPALQRVTSAGEALGLGERELLHAGPPIESPDELCAPIANSAVVATLFEGWAKTIDEAKALLRSGGIRMRPAQDVHCAVPLADVLSPSMRVQEIGDVRAPGRRAYSTLNGGNVHPMRVGILDEAVLAQLRWVNGPFADALAGALGEPIDVLPLADAGLIGGDDCHGRTGVATAALAAVLDARWRAADAQSCRDYFAQSPGIFLNVWMAATRCMLAAAEGVAGSSLVIGAGGNGTRFGIRIAGAAATWHVVDAAPPKVAEALPAGVRPLGAIGDSAIVDFLGLGAMTTRAGVDALPSFAAVYGDATAMPRALLAAAHPGLPRSCALMGCCATAVTDSRSAPIVSLGVLDHAGVRGRLAGGFYRPPLAVFDHAVASLAP
jgi:hypothetical protein